MKIVKFVKGTNMELYDKLVSANSKNNLYPKLYEELIEFYEACDNFRNNITGDNHLNVISEAVDVYLVGAQLGINPDDLKEFMYFSYYDRFKEYMCSETFVHTLNYKMARTILKLSHGDYSNLRIR